jgi:hypothetical protein
VFRRGKMNPENTMVIVYVPNASVKEANVANNISAAVQGTSAVGGIAGAPTTDAHSQQSASNNASVLILPLGGPSSSPESKGVLVNLYSAFHVAARTAGAQSGSANAAVSSSAANSQQASTNVAQESNAAVPAAPTPKNLLLIKLPISVSPTHLRRHSS